MSPAPLTKRQRQILDFIEEFREENGYMPSIEEIGYKFNLSSPATVHEHLKNLERKGMLRRDKHRSRSMSVIPEPGRRNAVEVQLLGYVSAGLPIEAIESPEAMTLPEDMLGRGETFMLRVKGDSMIEEHIRDGDYLIIEERKEAHNGETVVAMIRGEEATVKTFEQKGNTITLKPANPAYKPQKYKADEVEIVGRVIGVLRRYD